MKSVETYKKSPSEIMRTEIDVAILTNRRLGKKTSEGWTVEYQTQGGWVEVYMSAEPLKGLLTFIEKCRESQTAEYNMVMTAINNDPVFSVYINDLEPEARQELENAIRAIFGEDSESSDEEVSGSSEGELIGEGVSYTPFIPRKGKKYAWAGLSALVVAGTLSYCHPDDPVVSSNETIPPRVVPTVPTEILPTTTFTPSTVPETVPPTTIVIETTPPTTLPSETVPETTPETMPATTLAPVETVAPVTEVPVTPEIESIYTVQPGDSFNAIAMRYGIDPTVMASWNTQIADFTKIYSGQPIIVHESAAGSLGIAPPATTIPPAPKIPDDGVHSREVCVTRLAGTPYAAHPGENLTHILVKAYGEIGKLAAIDQQLQAEYKLAVIYSNPDKLEKYTECIPPIQKVREAYNRQTALQ